MTCKVILVEDDDILLKNSVEILQLDGIDAKGVSSAFDFFQLLATEAFDVAVVDVGLPDKSGLEVVGYLRKKTDMGVIILTARETIKDKISGYDAGADHYFVKPVDSRELTAAIRNLCTRLAKSSQVPTSVKQWCFDTVARLLVSPAGTKIALTIKEQNFIEHLIQNDGSPVTRMALLSTLGYNPHGPYGSRALDVMVVRLRKKIKMMTNEPCPIKTVHSFGFSFQSDVT